MINFCLVLLVMRIALISASDCPFGGELLQTAKDVYKARTDYENVLWKEIRVDPKDPGASFFVQSENDPQNLQDFANAELLVDYQEFLKDRLERPDGTCYLNSPYEYQCALDDCICEIPESIRCPHTEPIRPELAPYANYVAAKAYAPFVYLLAPNFEDGINILSRTQLLNDEYYSPRIIGNIIDAYKQEVLSKSSKTDKKTMNLKLLVGSPTQSIPNMFAAMFGQLIAHDISSLKQKEIKGEGNSVRCCSASYDTMQPMCHSNSFCAPISVPRNDPFYSRYNITCVNFVRAQNTLSPDCSLSGAPKVNTVSSHLNLGIVYGDSEDVSNSLRSFEGGKFELDEKQILPEGPDGYVAADRRVLQSIWLALLHAIFYRSHNNIAECLATVNPQWSDQKLFEKAQNINVAIYERLIYSEWLQAFLGSEACDTSYLGANIGSYDPTVEARTSYEFSHAVFRKFHDYVQSDVNFYDKNSLLVRSVKLSDTYLDPKLLKADFKGLARGMLQDPMKTSSPPGYSDELRNLFFKNDCGVGIDVFSADVQRGDDMGVARYIEFFPNCVGITIKCWKDLKYYFPEDHFKLLEKTYRKVEDIHLHVGVLLELPQYGGFGTIGACIMTEQFSRYKISNPSFYTFQELNPFTDAQIAEINKMSFANFLCYTIGLESVPANALEAPHPLKNPLISCSVFEPFDCTVFA